MNKFTPGPWELLGGTLIVGSDNHSIASICGYKSAKTTEEAYNNNRIITNNGNLIAAAPDMYEALHEYCSFTGGLHEDECPQDDTCNCMFKPLNDKINAALKKADGDK